MSSILKTHGGLIAVLLVMGLFSVIGWWSDRRRMRRNAEPHPVGRERQPDGTPKPDHHQ